MDKTVRIHLEPSGFVAGAGRAGRSVAELRQQAQLAIRDLGRMSGGMDTSSRSTAAMGASTLRTTAALSAMGVSVYGAVQQLRQGVAAAEAYSRSLTKIITLTDVSRQQLRGWEGDLKRIAVETGQIPAAVVGGLTAVTSAGIVSEEAMRATEAASKAAAIGLGEVNVIARLVSAAVQAYGPEVLSAAQATDQLLATVRVGAAEADEMAPALGRVLGMANQLGISFAEVGGFVATFTRLGIDANEAVTALRGTMATLIGPTKDQQEALALVGRDLQGLRREVQEKGLAQALVGLVAAFQGFEGGEDALARIIPNVRALSGVLGTAGAQAESFVANQRAIEESAGDVERALVELGKDPAFAMQQLRAEFALARQELGEGILPAIVEIGKAVHTSFDPDVAREFGRALGDIIKPLARIVELGSMFNWAALLAGWKGQAEAAMQADVAIVNAIGRVREFQRAVQETPGGGVTRSAFERAQADLKALGDALDRQRQELAQDFPNVDIRNLEPRDLSKGQAERLANLRNLERAWMVLRGAIGSVGQVIDEVADKPQPLKPVPLDLPDKLKRVVDQYLRTVEALALQERQEREIQELMRQTPYREVEAALKRLAIQHEVQRTVLEAEARLMELGAAKAREMALALGEQTRQTLTTKLATEELNSAMESAVRITDELAKGRVKLAEVKVPAFERGSLPWAVTTTEDVQLSSAHRADIERVLQIVRDLKTPAQRYREEVAEVERLMAKFPLHAAVLEEHLRRMQQEWNGYRVIMEGALRSTADLAKDVFAEIIVEGNVSWESVADALLRIWAQALAEMFARWVANLIRMKAAETAANLGSSTTGGGGGGGWASSLGGAAGGGGAGASSGGISSGAAGAAAGVAVVAAIVWAYGYQQGWWGSKGSEFRAGGTFGGAEELRITDSYGGKQKDVLRRINEVIQAVNAFVTDLDLEIAKFAQVTLAKRGSNYYAGLGAIASDMFASGEEAMAWAAMAAIKYAEFGDSVTEFMRSAIKHSKAMNLEALKSDIEFAGRLERAGKQPTELDVSAAVRQFNEDWRRAVDLFIEDAAALAVALTAVTTNLSTSLQATRDQITGRQMTAAEELALRQQQAALFNLQLAQLRASLEVDRIELRSEEEALRARIAILEGNARVSQGEIAVEEGLLRARGALLGVSLEMLQQQLAAVQASMALIDQVLANLPAPIDPSEIRLPRDGSRDRAEEREALRREAARFGIEDIAAALRDAADRHREYIERVREAGLRGSEAADLIRKSEEELARERAKIVRSQQLASGEFIMRGTPFGGDLLGGISDINAEMNRLLEGNRALVAEGQLSIKEMRELNNAIRESAERQRQALGRQAELGLLGELYGLLGMTEEAARLEWELKLAGLKIAYEELRIASEIYNLNLTYLEEIAGLIGEFERRGPPTEALAPTAAAGPERDTRADEVRRVIETMRDTFRDILDELIDFRDSLLLDEQLSPLTPQQRVAEALRQYEEVQARAAGGDVEALRDRGAIARNYLSEMLAAYGSTAPYQEAFQRVLRETGGLIENIDQLRESATEQAIRELGLNVLDFANRNQGNLARIIENTDPHHLSDNIRVMAEVVGEAIAKRDVIPTINVTLNPDGSTGIQYSYATGGVAYTPQIASLAERGPEAVLPLGALSSSGGGSDKKLDAVVSAVDRSGLETAKQIQALTRRVEQLAEQLAREGADRKRLESLLARVASALEEKKSRERNAA